MKKFWLITTDHLEDGLWFRDDEDFVTGMNYVAIQAALSPIVILCFILMSNHVHFFLYGTREQALAFAYAYKQRYSRYVREKYGIKELLRGNGIDIREVPLAGEAREKVAAYIQMNCVAANICSHPSQYQWGTGDVFFNAAKPRGVRMKTLSKRARIRMLHSREVDLPGEWVISDAGYILPSSYVGISQMESIFHSARRMNFFLFSSSKARKKIETSEASLPAFRDQIILTALPDLYSSLFQKEKFSDLSHDERVEALRQIRFRFCANVNQIARVTGLTYETAARLLDQA